ncbi:unnamed protein product [Leptosia nina]|uniref:Uncharacterized protein n=1 Tax=Leptosia nina TaxID=320188 RepID=A0AAV1J8B2_9NEOP
MWMNQSICFTLFLLRNNDKRDGRWQNQDSSRLCAVSGYRAERARGAGTSSQSAAAPTDARATCTCIPIRPPQIPTYTLSLTETPKEPHHVTLHVPILPVVLSRDISSFPHAGRVKRDTASKLKRRRVRDDRYSRVCRARLALVCRSARGQGCAAPATVQPRRWWRSRWLCVLAVEQASTIAPHSAGERPRPAMSAATPEVRGPPPDAASPSVALPRIKPELGLNDATLFAVYCFIKNFIG